MKILHVISSMDPKGGGVAGGVRTSVPFIQQMGREVEIVCLDDPSADFLAGETSRIHALGKARGPWAYHPALRPWLEKNLPRFDAVVLNGLWQYPGYALWKAARRAKKPYFVFPHGMLDPWFQRAPERRLKAVRNWLYWKLIEHRVIRDAAALCFTCAEELRLARGTFRPYQPRQELNVGYGIAEPPAFHDGMKHAFAEKCPGLDGAPYLLFLSRIHPKKGVDLLIRAYAENRVSSFKPQVSGFSLPKLVIAGPGWETEYGKQMQRLAAEVGNQRSETGGQKAADILFPGMLTGDAKWGALYGCEAFALPSHQENFGIAVVEALACGKPVLISDQINIWREIADDRAGLVTADTEAGAQELLRGWREMSAADRTAMGQRAKACFESRFQVTQAANNLIAAIESQLEK